MYLEHLGLLKARTVSRRPPTQGATVAHRARRVKTMARVGEISRALRAVHDVPRIAVTVDVVKNITSLYPKPPDLEPQEPISDAMDARTEDFPVDLAKFKASLLKTLLRLPRLSAPSILSMRNEHLVVLAKSSEANSLVDALARLAIGRVPSEVVQFLRGGLILPLGKDDGGFRPLTLANVLRRTALRSFVALRKDEISDAAWALAVQCRSEIWR